jgi:ribokinase
MAVLVVGDANADLVLTGDVVPRFGQAEQDVAAEIALGGSGAIAAAALARLGVEVAIAAAVGDDDLGRVVAARLEARGVARTALQRSARPTGLSVHLLRGVDRAILTSAGAIADLDVAAACATIAAGVRHVHLSSVYLIPPLVAGGGRVLAAARAAGATVSVDTNFDPSGAFAVPDWLPAADVILPNAAEARAMTGRDDVADAARDLAAEGATVAVKLGAAGALGVAGPDGEVVRADAPPAPDVVDAVGAGDAFDAGFLRARLDERPLEDALALGCACGALSTRRAGGTAAQPTLDEARALA